MNLGDVGLEKTVTLFLALGNGNGQRATGGKKNVYKTGFTRGINFLNIKS